MLVATVNGLFLFTAVFTVAAVLVAADKSFIFLFLFK